MTIKRALIFAPIILIVFLLQSYFWVPTYEQQTKGNPERLHEYITASTGDATLLNPILSTDATSSQIESLVFDALIDYNEELQFRGRLATSWELYEEAYFYVNERAKIPGSPDNSAEAVVEVLRKAMRTTGSLDPGLKGSLENIEEISIEPPREYRTVKQEKPANKDKKGRELKIRVRAPA
ncbi:MAG: peptide ABC transporter substrate-binding protein, partial [Desulfobacteraceae bacterium]|nr:peptide ABC transporter substrate-binding protein [Desulfobacteraceae bacterium]